MIIEAAKEKYEVLAHVFHGKINDSYVCLKSGNGKKCILNIIADTKVSKKLITILYVGSQEKVKTDTFTWMDKLCVELPYYESRSITRFCDNDINTVYDYEKVLSNMVFQCLSCELPFPVLYLALCQQKLNLYSNLDVSIGYAIDFTKLNPSRGEADCIKACLSIMLRIYDERFRQDSAVFRVISKKNRRDAYRSFMELYSDVQNSSITIERRKLSEGVKDFFIKYGHAIFTILKVIIVILAIVIVVMLICQIFLGDIPFIRIFTNTFMKIGTRELDK